MKALVLDLSRTLLFPKDADYEGSLNGLYKKINKENFWDHYYLDYDSIKEKLDLDLYIFTSGTVQKDKSIWDELKKFFEGIYNPSNVDDQPKDSVQAYLNLAELIGLEPTEIIYVEHTENLYFL